MGALIIMNTVWFLVSVFVAVDLDPPESAFRIHVISVADPGCLCHPGSRIKVTKIPDPEPHQRIKVFLTQKNVSEFSKK
jgi:hypothetical protein